MRVLLPAFLLLAACATPGPADSGPDDADTAPAATPDAEPIEGEPGFDAIAWMDAVDAADTDAEQIALTEQLLDAVDWRTACDEDDPTAEGRGTLSIAHLSDSQSLAAITCQRAAYQSTFVLIDARGGRPPRLVRSLGIDEAGTPTADTTNSFFGLLRHDRATAPSRFDILTKSAGHGGCGLDAHYRLLPDGGAAIEQIRAYADCNDPQPPEEWPVTYSAR